ncbi:hypothetical protein [Caulobacter sp. 1776]|uniref:hypothetical protein n=1 Tax=Caulobacter sp. 1776 TaxID=3156420 RepID=UPI0033942EEC
MSDEEEIAELKRRLAELEARRAQQAPPIVAPAANPAGQKPSRNGVGVALAVVVGLLLLMALLSQCRGPTGATSPSSNDDPVNATASNPSSSPAPSIPVAETWRYTDDVDPMNDRHTRTACVTSSDLVSLNSPYEPVTADLCIRNSAKFGLDTYFRLNGSGQILCDSYDGCTGHIRLDDGQRRAISMSTSADHSSEILFFSSGRSAMNLVAGAKVTRVELTYYEAGTQAVTFNTGGLDLSKLGVTRGKK